jgi:hypothetical protein
MVSAELYVLLGLVVVLLIIGAITAAHRRRRLDHQEQSITPAPPDTRPDL